MPTYGVGAQSAVATAATSGSLSLTAPTRSVGDLLLLLACTRFGTDNSLETNPTGYTELFAGSSTQGWQVWGRIATNDASDNTTLDFTDDTTRSIAYIIVLTCNGGWPAIGAVLGDTPSIGSNTVTGLRYRSHTITNDNRLAVQISKRNFTNTNGLPTSVAVTSGFTAAGFGAYDATNSLFIAAQVQGQTTASSLTQNDEVVTGNTESLACIGCSFTLIGNEPSSLLAFQYQSRLNPLLRM